MRDDTQVVFQFAGFTLDLAKGRLFHGPRDVVLRPKSFALLSYLARESGRVLTKDELMSAIWPDVSVTEDSLTQCVHDLRQALGRDAAGLLRTVPRRGYLFESAFDADALRREATAEANAPPARMIEPPGDAIAPKLRRDGIAVMPFVLTSGSQSDAQLLDGLAQDVISRLARLRSFHVIARGSTFALRHLTVDPKAAGRALGVAYVFQGWATIKSGLIRLQVDLVDSSDGRIVWTDEISGRDAGHGLFVDDLADRLTHAVAREISVMERDRSLLSPDEGLDAWQAYHRGLFHMLKFTTEESLQGRQFFERAIQLEPGFARAHAGVSYCHFLEAFMKPRNERRTQIDRALSSASRAMELDEQNPNSRWAYGRALWLGGDESGAISHLSASVDLSPSFAMGYQTLSFMLSQSGSPSEAIRHAERATALSPHDPFLCAIYGSQAMALLRLGKLEEAVSLGLLAASQHNVHKHILGIAAIALAAAGREDQARDQLSRIRALDGNYDLSRFIGAFMQLSDDSVAVVTKAAHRIGLV